MISLLPPFTLAVCYVVFFKLYLMQAPGTSCSSYSVGNCYRISYISWYNSFFHRSCRWCVFFFFDLYFRFSFSFVVFISVSLSSSSNYEQKRFLYLIYFFSAMIPKLQTLQLCSLPQRRLARLHPKSDHRAQLCLCSAYKFSWRRGEKTHLTASGVVFFFFFYHSQYFLFRETGSEWIFIKLTQYEPSGSWASAAWTLIYNDGGNRTLDERHVQYYVSCFYFVYFVIF